MFKEDQYVTARGVNTYVFCPRLFWLEQVAGEFTDNEHTIEGRRVHKRVDHPGGNIDAPQRDNNDNDDNNAPKSMAVAAGWHARSLWLSHPEIGVSAMIDHIIPEELPNQVMPVDTKKGKPDAGNTLWKPDRVQLTLQALLLRAHGYDVTRFAAWYHSARKRVVCELSDELIQEALTATEQARQCLYTTAPTPPLLDDPKCFGCSLHAICQPDEVNALGHCHLSSESELLLENQPENALQPVRRVFSPRDDALPLYIQEAGTRIGLSAHCLKITPRKDSSETEQEVGLGQISQVNLMGAIQITTQAIQACLRNDIPLSFFSSSGWFYGRTDGFGSRQVQIRIAQFKTHETPRALEIARVLIADKIANARTLLRRNVTANNEAEIHGSTSFSEANTPSLARELDDLDRLRKSAEEATSAESLLGLEGTAARIFWRVYSSFLAESDAVFAMNGRSRRPPRDPTNALLSFGYALLAKDCTLAASACGLDPFLGVFHTPHHGRPSMALDLMEPYRPLIVDSSVLTMIRRGWIKADDFTYTGQAVTMKPQARKKLIQSYERRMDELVTHPIFGYRISYRRVLHVQARLLTRVLTGELDTMPSFRTR